MGVFNKKKEKEQVIQSTNEELSFENKGNELLNKKNKKKEKSKKRLKRRLIRVAVILIVVAIGYGFKLYGDNKMKDYASDIQMAKIASSLDADLSYMIKSSSGSCNILAHNNEEPIYITFDKSCSQDVIDTAKQTLDYLFDYIVQFNDKYKYLIVADAKSGFFSDKTVIEYKAEDLGEVNTKLSQEKSLSNILTGGRYNHRFIISYDKESFDQNKMTENQEYNSLLKELCHAFQFNNTNSNSIMNLKPENENIGIFSENDIKCLASVYSPKISGGQQFKNIIDVAKSIIQNRKQEVTENVMTQIPEKRKTFDFTRNKFIFKDTLSDGTIIYYNILLKNFRYRIGIVSENDITITEQTGEIGYKDKIVYLRNLRLTHGFGEKFLNNKDTISDIAIFRQEDGEYKIADLDSGVLDCSTIWVYGDETSTYIPGNNWDFNLNEFARGDYPKPDDVIITEEDRWVD